MADVIFSNNASALLAATIDNSELVIQVAGGFGTLFPSPTGSQYFMLALEDSSGNVEICKCTSRATDLLTVVRGQDGTVGQAFTLTVTRVELRVTAAVLEEFVQVTGDSMSGNLDMATNEIENAELTGTTIITGGQSVGMSIRGTLGQTDNEIVVPAGSGVRATAGGADLVVDTDDIIALLDTAGVIDLASATVGVKIGTAGAGDYLRFYGGSTSYVQFAHDDTDLLVTAVTTGDLSIDNLNVVILGGTLTLSDSLLLQDQLLSRPEIKDFSLTKQTVSASATTNIDYEAGSFVQLDMDQTITNLNITNPPATGKVGSLRIKIKQDGVGSHLISNWPSGITWPDGGIPTLSTSPNAVDYVDMWTDDEGTVWAGVFNSDWS